MGRKPFAEQLAELRAAGYRLPDAQAKVAHDAVLYAMYKCGFKKNGTIKGRAVIPACGRCASCTAYEILRYVNIRKFTLDCSYRKMV
ncbi:MAG: hypothetical protein IJH50_14560 [Kiritimatiellae bacterium]|nr:hypothetical protein [Kiritimatiellia bacterium]